MRHTVTPVIPSLEAVTLTQRLFDRFCDQIHKSLIQSLSSRLLPDCDTYLRRKVFKFPHIPIPNLSFPNLSTILPFKSCSTTYIPNFKVTDYKALYATKVALNPQNRTLREPQM
jgi:hypothetical protein